MLEHSKKHIVKVNTSSDRVFGLVFCVVFLIISLLPILAGNQILIEFLIIAAILLLLALFTPRTLGPANKLWTSFGNFLHRIVSPVVMGIMFFAVVFPIGMVLRVLQKDPLRLRKDPMARSYWIERDPPGPTGDSLNNQF